MLYAECFTLVEHITQCAHLHSATSGSPDDCGFALNGLNADGTIPAGEPVIFNNPGNPICTDQGDLSLVDASASTGALCYNFFLDEGTKLFAS